MSKGIHSNKRNRRLCVPWGTCATATLYLIYECACWRVLQSFRRKLSCAADKRDREMIRLYVGNGAFYIHRKLLLMFSLAVSTVSRRQVSLSLRSLCVSGILLFSFSYFSAQLFVFLYIGFPKSVEVIGLIISAAFCKLFQTVRRKCK